MRTLAVILALAFPVFAQQPIDPLRRPEETVGQYTWRLSLGYTPSGREGVGVDELGRPYTFTTFSQEWRLTLSGTVQLATGLKAGVEVSEQTVFTQEVRRYPEEVRLSFSRRAVSSGLFCEYRLDPQKPWDPRASFLLGYPWKGGAGLSLSLLRDPMVLVADLSVRYQEEEPWSWFMLGLGAGFVANLWINISASATLAVPVGGIGVPQTSLSIRARYALDVKGKQEIGLRANLVLRGEQTWLGLEAEWLGRGP
ncbi:MAG: hypothetical protein ACPLZE_05290 [Candidatus Bipolaricaulaceae bacterium]